MSPRDVETAAEFCKLVGKADLLDYLGISSALDAGEARAKLRDRRKYMQGMQSNPKFRHEALFLIKNFASLEAALEDLPSYRREVARQHESQHLPIVEMTIRSVLRGGALSTDQADYLHRNALELGVSESTFREMLARLAAEANVTLPDASTGPRAGVRTAAPPTAPPTTAASPPASYETDGDLYALLGVGPTVSRDQVYEAYQRQFALARQTSDPSAAEQRLDQLDRAWKVLGDASARRAYDLSRSPPGRTRESGPPTAPPVRPRTEAPASPPRGFKLGNASATESTAPPATATLGRPRLELPGDAERHVVLGDAPAEHVLVVRNSGFGRMPGRVSTDAPWLVASPSQLAPDQPEQAITVRVSPRDLPSRAGTASLTIQTDAGERASITFVVEPAPSGGAARLALFGALLTVLLVLLGVGVALGVLDASEPEVSTLTIQVDPTAEQILLDGQNIGSGRSVYVDRVRPGKKKLTVIQPNFEPYTAEILVEPGRPHIVPVALALDRPLDFRPAATDTPGTLDPTFVDRVMAQRGAAMDECVRAAAQEGRTLSGAVRIHVGPNGQPMGVELEGTGAEDPKVRDCLGRQAAAAMFHPFSPGDYATVRYDYQVTEAAP